MIQLHSEKFPSTGGMTADGFKRLLGRPALSMLQTVLREALQNVVDAGYGTGPTQVQVGMRTLSGVQAANLRSRILSELPIQTDSRSRLSAALGKKHLRILEICDFGTVGLSGPTRADRSGNGNEPRNFINFMKNIGAVRDTAHGGGTYGYGKSSLYAMSRCSTILVDSQTIDNGRPVRRLMACHLGNTFEHSGMRYTGRHWWGISENDNVEPCTGATAAELAQSLGLPPRDASRSGTSIMIIDPDLDDDTDSQRHCEKIIEAIMWNFWPRMTSDTPHSRRLNVDVQCEGVAIQMPQPEKYPPLDLYSQALSDIRTGKDSNIRVKHQSKRKFLGNLALSRGFRATRMGDVRQSDEDNPAPAPLRLSHHVALMRPVELVVRYLPGDPLPDERFEWAGVFICSDEDEIESAFAQSEPPAHDDWMPANLPRGDAQKYVRMALNNINKETKRFSTPSIIVPGPDGSGPSLARIAGIMGQLLGTPHGDAPGKTPGGSKSGTRSARRSSMSRPIAMGLRSMPDGTAVACFHSRLSNDGKDASLRLTATPMLAIDGGGTTMEQEGSPMPKIISMGFAGSMPSVGSNDMLVGLQEGIIEILVSLVKDAAITLSLALGQGADQ